MGETAACTECGSHISVEARRCPQCGYEPGELGVVVQVLENVAWVSVGMVLTVMATTWWIMLGFPQTSLLDVGFVTVVFLTVLTGLGLLLYGKHRAENRLPTED